MVKTILTTLALCASISAHALTEAELLTKSFSYLNKNKRTITQEEVANVVQEIRYNAWMYGLNEQHILKRLKEMLQENITFHAERLHKKRDNEALHLGIGCVVVAAASAGMVYLMYQKLHKPNSERYDQICNDLQANGVKVTDNTLFTHTFDLSIQPDCTMSANDIENSGKELVSLHESKKLILFGEFVGVLASLAAGTVSLAAFYTWLNPDHKELYERYCFIQKELTLVSPLSS